MVHDIFISFKYDGAGEHFASRLKNDLDLNGYSVYFNPEEQKSGEFPIDLETEIQSCTDFIIVISSGCLDQLVKNEKIDWVRQEIVYAKSYNKNIIPVLIGNVTMPKDKSVLPNSIQFIADLYSYSFPVEYQDSPFNSLIKVVKSKPTKGEYKYIFNSNPDYIIENDFNITKRNAENGDASSMYELGCMYYFGYIGNSYSCANYKEATRWFKMAVDCYNKSDMIPDYIICSYTMLANMYYSGSVYKEEQSFGKTIEILKGVVDVDYNYDYAGMYEKIGFMLSNGVGSEFDFDSTISFFEKYEQKCSNNAKNNIAKFYMRYGLFAKAVKVLESINEAYPDADYKLGLIYLQGLHVKPFKPDLYRAEHFLSRAALNGHSDALHALGLMNFRGQYGYPKNFYKAREYYRSAALRGHRGAQYDYAWMCKYGLGGKTDISEAIYYFEKSALQGHLLSMAELALLYQEPDYTNYQKAFEWANKAALAGDPQSEFILANFFLFGRGCNSDINKAVIFYHRALDHGFYQAKFMLDKIEQR